MESCYLLSSSTYLRCNRKFISNLQIVPYNLSASCYGIGFCNPQIFSSQICAEVKQDDNCKSLILFRIDFDLNILLGMDLQLRFSNN
ncbi:hypothetical protein X975_02113, partial [Stegodyphus mimosarum]